jgi:phosphate transport system protein
MARAVCTDDERVDQLNREIIHELIDAMKRSPHLIEPLMHLFSASRHIERVADHATNIAEDVVYLVEGAIIRHRSGLHESVS